MPVTKTIYKHRSPDVVEFFTENADGSITKGSITKGSITKGQWLTRKLANGTDQMRMLGKVVTVPVLIDETYSPWEELEILIAKGFVVVQKSKALSFAHAIADFKDSRQAQLNAAIVTTSNGSKYDADEVSITRMGFALVALSGSPLSYELLWSLADTNTGVMTVVTFADLKEAQALAVQNMSDIWAA